MTATTRWSTPGGPWIVTPATAPARFAAARASGATVTVVDLEDSVAPGGKDAARERAADFFATADPAGPVPGIRINALTNREGLRDLTTLADYPHRPQIVVLPMVESARDIELAAAALDTDSYAPQLWALVETPRAVEKAAEICAAPRLAGLAFGAADYAAATGAARTWEALLHPRAQLANSAAAAGIAALDFPWFDLKHEQGLRREALRARDLGLPARSPSTPARSWPSLRRSAPPRNNLFTLAPSSPPGSGPTVRSPASTAA
ncbi:aldolase/citrate lyase family protein [Streptomyces sp. NPDC008125]|uniref:aldolase/citrate lyase family protein n=1 Tax=Streptomyces sp. NPDC008125 TaxID=3364811 RepID=UPI0036E7F524